MVESNKRIATIAIMFNGGAVDGGNVQFAVVVAVKEGNTTAHGLDDIVLLCSGDMRDGQARLVGEVLELSNSGGRWSFSLGHRKTEGKQEKEGPESNDEHRSGERIRFVMSHESPSGHPEFRAMNDCSFK